ncbi:hypothetical protein M2139_001720 [Enterococcus sp. PF1-24]|uniref:hypothetical protein n=1 Tax=unclassified Enterococcus TaxID=2608891 RepID=UPI002474702F|nr:MULTISPECIES: hypothetical protein [unclassified Enterococcus]MDH6364704.1 hypothetical protein [Enterococcus sp. PFB1-1]MDH6401820.1 hypothetical protein [Enterococcus sp. PF1-24]
MNKEIILAIGNIEDVLTAICSLEDGKMYRCKIDGVDGIETALERAKTLAEYLLENTLGTLEQALKE